MPKIVWLHKGMPIQEGKDITIYQDSEGISKLAISEVFPEDAGEYTCKAINKVGEAVCASSLIVEGILNIMPVLKLVENPRDCPKIYFIYIFYLTAYEYVPDSEIASTTVGTSFVSAQTGSEENLLIDKVIYWRSIYDPDYGKNN